jgi:hypothetical protein
MNGGFQSGFNNIKDIEHVTKLFMVKGKKDIRIVQVKIEIIFFKILYLTKRKFLKF